MALLSLRNITLAFGGPPLFEGIDLQIEAGDRLCLLGRNGSGKSTLMRLISGELSAEQGELSRQPGLKVALVSQDTYLFNGDLALNLRLGKDDALSEAYRGIFSEIEIRSIVYTPLKY